MAGLGAGISGLTTQPFWQTSPSFSPNDAIGVALIGCSSMGAYNLENCLKQAGVVCRALCDVDSQRLQKLAAEISQKFNQRPILHRDWLKILEMKSVDAVIIATPDHWHAVQTIYACKAGKHVYVEKPMANSLGEAHLLAQASSKYQRIIQVGQQQRSGLHWQEVVDLIRHGNLGKINMVDVWANFMYAKGATREADQKPPAGIDYEMWLGPAPKRPYNPSRFHGNWRFQWDYGGGLLTDWGVHLLDIVCWAMDLSSPPLSVQAQGGIFRYPRRAIETPDTLQITYTYPDLIVNWKHLAGIENGPFNRNYGLAFYGELGTLVVNRESWELIPNKENGKALSPAIPPQEGNVSDHPAHAADFIQALRANRAPICPPEKALPATTLAHLGNIAHRTQNQVQWQPDKLAFSRNRAAERLIYPEFRTPWVLEE
ncbi:MAG: Gfo/Idh/MocA family oxidoreductase [Bacteroidota bacterium]